MKKIILDLAVSLDGCIEGPNGEVDWCIMDEEMGFDKFLNDIDTIFYGRISYEIWGEFRAHETAGLPEKKLWDAVHSKSKYVFSTKKSFDSSKVTTISSDIESSVNVIRNMPGKNIWLYGGASLITTFMNLNLIDEYRLSVHPVILGKGKPVFSNLQSRLDLKLKEAKSYSSGVTLLSYVR